MNQSRRNFLKFLLIASGALFLGKLFGLNLFSKKKNSRIFRNFRVMEEGEELAFYNQQGEKLLIIEKP